MRQQNEQKKRDTLETANELNNYLFARTKKKSLDEQTNNNIKRSSMCVMIGKWWKGAGEKRTRKQKKITILFQNYLFYMFWWIEHVFVSDGRRARQNWDSWTKIVNTYKLIENRTFWNHSEWKKKNGREFRARNLFSIKNRTKNEKQKYQNK